MNVKNEYVKINVNKKEYILRNYIYDSYLKLFSDRQKEYYEQDVPGIDDNLTDLSYCVIKLDEPLDNYQNAQYLDFDLLIHTKNKSISGNNVQVSALYNYSSAKKIFDITTGNEITDMTPYNNRKITAIGFCGARTLLSYTDFKVYACVDTSYYSIKIDSSESIEVSRKDVISSNAIYGESEFPLHLAPILNRLESSEEDKGAKSIVRPKLYSVGFGRTLGRMSEEFVIGEEAEIETIDDTTYSIVMNNPVAKSVFPQMNSYPSSNRYPLQPELKKILQPSFDLQPRTGLYPMDTGYNYIIFKYRLYCNFLDHIVDLDEFYTMNYPYSPKGIFSVKNKIERGG